MCEREKKTKNSLIQRTEDSSQRRTLRGSRQKGFTLVELIVVLVILAIVAAIIMPALLSYIDSGKEKEAKIKAQKALAATQTALSDIYNDGENSYHPKKRLETRKLAGSTVDDGTEFTVWTEERLWDGRTVATSEHIGSYTIKQALYKENDSLYFYYDGKKWKMLSAENTDNLSGAIEDIINQTNTNDVIYVWPYSSDYAYLGEEGSSYTGRDVNSGIITKTITIELGSANAGKVSFVREGRFDKEDFSSLKIIMLQNKETKEVVSYWYSKPDSSDDTNPDRFEIDDFHTYMLYYERGYSFKHWRYNGDTGEDYHPYYTPDEVSNFVFSDENAEVYSFSFTLVAENDPNWSGDVYVSKERFKGIIESAAGQGVVINNIEHYGESDLTLEEVQAIVENAGAALAKRTDDESNSYCSMYSWIDGDTLKWWSDGSEVYMPADCSEFFKGADNLTVFDFSGFNVSLISDMREMFSGCSNIVTITLGNEFGSDGLTDVSGMFENCGNLSSLDLVNLTTGEGVGTLTSISRMFSGCSSLTELDFGVFDTSKVEDWTEVFSGCALAEIINTDSLDTSSATNMTGLFSGCEKLSDIDISGWNLDNVTTFNSTFKGCSSLTALPTGLYSTDKLIDLTDTFSGCSSITRVDFTAESNTGSTGDGQEGSGDTNTVNTSTKILVFDNVTSVAGLFSDCTALEEVVLGDSFVCDKVTSMAGMFKGCSSLVTLDLKKLNPAGDKIENTSEMFMGCSVLQTIYVTDPDFNNGYGFFYHTRSGQSKNITSSDNMFSGCTVLNGGNGTTVTGMSSSDAANAYNATYACVDKNGQKGYFKYKIRYAQLVNTGKNWPQDTSNKNDGMGNRLDASNKKTLATKASIKRFERASDITSADQIGKKVEGKNDLYSADGSTVVALDLRDPNYINEDGESFPVYFWVEGTTMKWWSEADMVYVNPSTVLMFQDWNQVEIIDLQRLDFSLQKNIASEFQLDKQLKRIIDGSTGDSDTECLDYIMVTSSATGGTTPSNNGNAQDRYGMNLIFADCSSLESVDLSGFDASNVTSMYRMFYNAAKLETISFPENFDTSKVTTMKQMFYGCTSLISLDLDSFDGDALTTVQYMFNGCSALESVSFENSFNCSLLTDTSYMFNGCSKISSIDISMITAPNLQTAAYMFNNCKLLQVIDMRKVVAKSITNITSMFANCNALKTLYMNSFDGRQLTSLSGWFNGKTTLETVNLSSLNSASLTNTFQMFMNCTSLSNLTLGKYDSEGQFTFACEKVTTMQSMFNGCKALTSLDLSGIKGGKVQNANAMFNSCSKLESLDLSNFDSSALTNVSSMFNSCSVLKTLTFGNGFSCKNVLTMEKMFYNCAGLETLDISMMQGLEVTNISNMFAGCAKLKTLNMHKFDGGKLTQMAGWFNGLKVLETLDLTSLNSESLLSADNMFKDCQKLSTLTLGSGKFTCKNVTSMKYMFYNCYALDTLTLDSNFECESVNDMTSMFQNCKSLVNLDIHMIKAPNVYLLSNMFNGCSSLKTLDMSGVICDPAVGSYDDGMRQNMFSGCTNIETILLTSFKGTCFHNFDKWFQNLKKLKKVDLSSLNPSRDIEDASDGQNKLNYMFQGCSALTEVIFGSDFKCEKITTMEGMFDGCSSLEVLDLSMLNTKALTNTTCMFRYCTKLKEIYVSDPDKTNDQNIGFYKSTRSGFTRGITSSSYMFQGCDALDGGNGTTFLGKNRKDDATYACIDKGTGDDKQEGYFRCGPKTKYAYLKAMNENWPSTVSASPAKKNITSMVRVNDLSADQQALIDNGTAKNLGDGTPSENGEVYPVYFWYEGNVMKWWTEADVIYVNAASTQVFNGWNNVQTIDLHGMDFSKQINMEKEFYYCNNLKRIIDGSAGDYAMKTDSATSMKWMFDYCRSLESIDLSLFNTANVTNMGNMFARCENIVRFDLSSFDSTNLTICGSMFKQEPDKAKVEEIIFGPNFKLEKVEDAQQMFYECIKLKKLDISMFNTQKLNRCNGMFYDCKALTTIEVTNPSNSGGKGFMVEKVTTYNYDEKMFFGCNNIKGGNGTTYNGNKINKSYAHVDVDGNPGYFTEKNAQ